jgi:presenilin-like A22 family membrane protease
MNKKNTLDFNEILAVFFMGCLFILIQGLSLLIIQPFEAAGVEPAFENPEDPTNILYILGIILIFTIIILLIARFWKKQLIQFIILGAIGYTTFYVLYPLLTLIIPQTLLPLGPLVAAILIAGSLLFLLYKYPEWYILDLCGIIIGAGAIAIFGMSLSIFLVIILLIVLAIYDAISVYKTKHMIDLADTVMDLKLPVLLVIPKKRHYSLIKETQSLKEKIEENQEREAFFMGLGDIVMPGILVAAVYTSIDNGLFLSIAIMIGTLLGFALLMTFVLKGRPQAGLPCLCGGAILGYLIGSLILYGQIIGISLTF